MASQSSNSIEHFGLLAALALQFGMQPFLAQSCTPKGVLKSSLVITIESLKVLLSFLILVAGGRLRELARSWTFKGFLYAAGFPSITYLIQGYCIQVAYQELDAVAFNVLNQTKLPFTALFVYIITGRGQSRMQCVALFFITVSGALISLNDFSSVPSATEASISTRGLCAISLGSALSGLGAGVTERVLRTQHRDNFQLSAEMSGIGCVLGMASLFLGISPDSEYWWRDGLFSNWQSFTVIPVMTQAMAGLLVGLITKVAGSVQKSFATICGIMFTCLLRATVTGSPPSLMACIAVVLASVSIYTHSRYPRKTPGR